MKNRLIIKKRLAIKGVLLYFFKMKFRWGSKLLHLKQVTLFVTFGLIVGYVSFISGTFYSGLEIIRNFHSGIESIFEDKLNEKDWLYEAFILSPDKGKILLDQISRFIPPEQKPSFQFNLYMKDRANQQWTVLASSDSKRRGSFPNDESLIHSLDKTEESGMEIDRALFLGQENQINLFQGSQLGFRQS